MDTKSQNSNMLLAFLTLTGVIAIVALVGFFMLRKGPEIIQGQAEVTEYRVSSKVPGRILEFRVKEGQSVQAGDTLAILEAPDVQAKLEQARAAEAAAQAQNEKALKGARQEQIQAAYEIWQKARAGLAIAEKSYKRVKNLHDQGVMSAQKLDEVTAQRDAAQATEKAVSVKLGVYDGFSQICKIKGNRRIVRDHQICLGKNVLVGIRRIHKFYPWIMTEHMQTVNGIWVRHEADGISVPVSYTHLRAHET